MEDQIKAAIAECVERHSDTLLNPMRFLERKNQLVSDLYAAIKPHLPAQESWEDAPEWAEWLALSKRGACYFEKCPDFVGKADCFLVSAGRWQAQNERDYGGEYLLKRPKC